MTPLVVAHRNNLSQETVSTENTYDGIMKCFEQKLSVEIDIWYIENKFWVGHDKPERNFHREIQWLYYLPKSSTVFVHAKNIEAMNELINRFDTRSEYNSFDYFMHDKDEAVLTKKGYIWTFPGQALFENSIAVMPELCFEKYQKKVEELFLTNKIKGICSNDSLKWKKLYEEKGEK